jgi:hypothetical protein
LSATTTVSSTSILVPEEQAGVLSKVARFGNEFCKLFQVLLVFVVKAILDSTIDIDDGDYLDERQQSASFSSFDISPSPTQIAGQRARKDGGERTRNSPSRPA